MKSLRKPIISPLSLVLILFFFFVAEVIAAKYYMSIWAEKLIDSTFQSPLQSVVVAKRGPTVTLKTKYDLTQDWFTPNIPIWEKVLKPFKGKPVNYLEIGAFEGRSVIWMLENILIHPESKVTAIDIFDGDIKERYYKNIKLSGREVTTIENYSQLALRELPFYSFDIIYIDGSHAKKDVLEDAVLSWRLIKDGGILIFDDYRYAGCFTEEFGEKKDFPKPAVDAFTQCFDDQFEVIHNDYQLILRRTSKIK